MSMKVVCGGALVGMFSEGGVDLRHIERQPAQRAVPFGFDPVGRRDGVGIDRKARTGLVRVRSQAAKTERTRHLQPRADDGIVDHHHRHRRAGNDVHLMPRAAGFRLGNEVEAGITGDQRLDLRIRNADEDDGLGVFHQPDADDLGILVHRHERMDRLAGIAGRSHEIRGDEDPGHRLAALQHRRHGQIVAHRAEAIGARYKIRSRRSGQIFLQHRRRAGRDRKAKAGTKQKDKTEEFHSKAFLQIVAGALECSRRAVVDLGQTSDDCPRKVSGQRRIRVCQDTLAALDGNRTLGPRVCQGKVGTGFSEKTNENKEP
jgi:hypothetical protein